MPLVIKHSALAVPLGCVVAYNEKHPKSHGPLCETGGLGALNWCDWFHQGLLRPQEGYTLS